MNLRLKMLVVLATLWAGISLIIISYSKYTLSEDYIQLERKQVVNAIEQTEKTLNSMMAALHEHNADWAQWDNTYQFMQDKNNAYIKANCTGPAFKNIGVNVMLFFKPDGTLWFGLNYDDNKNQFVPIPPLLISTLQHEKSYLFQAEDSIGKTGILKFDDEFVLLSAMPILNSDAKGPARGTMVMSYFFTTSDLGTLSSLAHVHVDFFPLPLTNKDDTLTRATDALQTGSDNVVIPLNQKVIYGFTFIKDANNHPIGLLRITLPRELVQQAKHIIERYISIILLMGVLFLMTVWLLLKTLVLDKVVELNQQITEIKTTGQFTKRVLHRGQDEINRLAIALNDLLEIIEVTQTQLKYRLSLRTEELARLALLNKNLYNEVSQQKETDLKILESEKTLKQLAYYDPITGLPNRLFFREIVQKLLLKSERDGSSLAILMLDAHKFKQINDLYGDVVGEQFLKETAARLTSLTQAADVIARIAGDEFILCLTNTRGKETIKKIVEPILLRLSEPHQLEGLILSSSFSVGLSVFPDDGDSIQLLEHHAEVALRQAEQRVQNNLVFYSDIKDK